MACHLLIAMGFVRYSSTYRPASDSVRRPPPQHKDSQEPPIRQPEVRLGIARSAAHTMAWLGFEEPTEHQAPLRKTEQSEMTLAAPGPKVAAASPSQPEPTPQPTPHQISQAWQRTIEAGASRVAVAMEAAARRLSELGRELPDPRSTAGAASKPAEETPPPPPPPSPAVTSADSGGGGQHDGMKADKEAIATAVRKAPSVKPGQVVAAEGLEVFTREPRWSVSTLMTRRPRNPTVEITFGRDGRVRKAEFVRKGSESYNTGWAEVDQPLLSAIYGWSAKGKALGELDPNDPEAGLTIMITINLNG
jgi:hypothetical protein